MNANRYMRDSLRTADRSNMDRLKLECALGLCGEALFPHIPRIGNGAFRFPGHITVFITGQPGTADINFSGGGYA